MHILTSTFSGHFGFLRFLKPMINLSSTWCITISIVTLHSLPNHHGCCFAAFSIAFSCHSPPMLSYRCHCVMIGMASLCIMWAPWVLTWPLHLTRDLPLPIHPKQCSDLSDQLVLRSWKWSSVLNNVLGNLMKILVLDTPPSVNWKWAQLLIIQSCIALGCSWDEYTAQ